MCCPMCRPLVYTHTNVCGTDSFQTLSVDFFVICFFVCHDLIHHLFNLPILFANRLIISASFWFINSIVVGGTLSFISPGDLVVVGFVAWFLGLELSTLGDFDMCLCLLDSEVGWPLMISIIYIEFLIALSLDSLIGGRTNKTVVHDTLSTDLRGCSMITILVPSTILVT